MKLPISMLFDFVKVSLNAGEIAELLTMAGFEVEKIEIVEGEEVLEIKVCSNRGDGLSALGLAREILAKNTSASPTDLYIRASNRFKLPDENTRSVLSVPVTIECETCSRFAYRGFKGLRNISIPDWIQKRLRQMGFRPISFMVDLTNYVMVELGQPLHAYDLNKLSGPAIIVRNARVGEKLITLDGVERELTPNQMIICDSKNPIGVAGIMGGLDSEISNSTIDILLESAHFNSQSVRKTRKHLGLNTEASYRFERSADPEGVVAALNRVRELVVESGHEQGSLEGVTDEYPGALKISIITLEVDRVSKLLGMMVTPDECRSYLTKLGCSVDVYGDIFQVKPPSWRPDLVGEEDLIEDIGRIHGYEKVPELLPFGSTARGGVWGFYRLQEELVERAISFGFDQTVTHSLVGSSVLCNRSSEPVEIRNPNSPDTKFLRNSLLPGLADVLIRNGTSDGHYFELGSIFQKLENQYLTQKSIALISCGGLMPLNRKGDQVPVADFYSLKACLEHLVPTKLQYGDSSDARLQPFQQANVRCELFTGILGRLHPKICKLLGVADNVFAMELLLSGEAFDDSTRQHFALSRNPSVRRDVSFVISKEIPYSIVEKNLQESLGSILESMWLFDVYEGAGIADGSHSLAIALTLRKSGENFTDEQANQEREKAVRGLESLGAKLR